MVIAFGQKNRMTSIFGSLTRNVPLFSACVKLIYDCYGIMTCKPLLVCKCNGIPLSGNE